MNILILSWRDPRHPLAGGAEQVVLEHCKGWIEAGHAVTWFSSKFDSSRAHVVIDGVSVVRSGNQYLGVQISAFFYYFRHRKKFDIVIDQFHGIPFFTPLYVKKPKLAVLQEVAKEVWFLNGFPFPLNYIIGTLGFLIEPLIFLFYKKIPFMVGSQSAEQDLIKTGIPSKNITTIPHGVIVPKYKIVDQKSKIKTVIFLGALTKDKGVEDAIRAFSMLNKLGNYKFWVVGAGGDQYTKNLLVLTKSLGIADKVKFWGRVDNNKKFELLSKSFLLINPSIREGWGLVNIEANAMGVPVIAYPSQGLVDSVRDGLSGLITKSKTPESLATEVDKLKRDMKEYERLSIGARKWATTFDWKKSRQMSLKLINSLL